MIDFVKVFIRDFNVALLMENPNLKYLLVYDEVSVTGEFKNILRARYHDLKISLYLDSNSVKITGSLHKLYNAINGVNAPNQRTQEMKAKGFNGNQFSKEQLFWTLEHIQDITGISLDRCVIQNIEFGVNLPMKINTNDVLKGLMLHKGKGFSMPLPTTYRVCLHGQYSVKCYDKQLQYSMATPTMRVEVSYKKTETLNRNGIRTLQDLFNNNVLEWMKGDLIGKWSEILMYDETIRYSELKESEKTFLLSAKNPVYWMSLRSNRRDKPRKQLKRIVNDHSERWQQQIAGDLGVRWDSLMSNK